MSDWPSTTGATLPINLTTDVTGVLPSANIDSAIARLTDLTPYALLSGTLAQFAATTSLQLKNTISDETGSGALVFATSPTLVTPLLGTPTSGTLTNCTGYIEANLVTTDVITNNVSITKHGFAPKAPNDATKYLDGTGVYTVPAGSGGGITGSLTSGRITVGAGASSVQDYSNFTYNGTSLTISSTGPHSIGGSTVANKSLILQGTFSAADNSTFNCSFDIVQTFNLAANATGVGLRIADAFVEAGSGTHSRIVFLSIESGVTNGTATTTDLVGLDIAAATAATGTTTASALRIAGFTSATTNWAINVTSGDCTFGGKIYGPGMTNANAQDYVCYNTTTKELEQNVTTCNLSTERVKDGITEQSPESMLSIVLNMIPVSFILNIHPELGDRLGFTAERTEPIDKRLVTYFANGEWKGKLRSVDYEGYTAVLTGAIQAQQKIIEMQDKRIIALARHVNL